MNVKDMKTDHEWPCSNFIHTTAWIKMTYSNPSLNPHLNVIVQPYNDLRFLNSQLEGNIDDRTKNTDLLKIFKYHVLLGDEREKMV